MNDLDSPVITNIITQAKSLQSSYDERALYGLLEGELQRLEREQALVLVHPSAREIVKGILLNLGDELRAHSHFTTALLTLIAVKTVHYLAAQDIIASDNILFHEFIVTVSVALVMSAIYKQWDSSRNSSGH
jgi:hypothetical protein